MVIDVNNSINTGGPRGRTGSLASTPTDKPQTPAATPEKNPAVKENVVLSAEARNLQRLQDKISKMPDADLERVAQIKKAIADGKFEINAERIAENMLNQEKLLG